MNITIYKHIEYEELFNTEFNCSQVPSKSEKLLLFKITPLSPTTLIVSRMFHVLKHSSASCCAWGCSSTVMWSPSWGRNADDRWFDPTMYSNFGPDTTFLITWNTCWNFAPTARESPSPAGSECERPGKCLSRRWSVPMRRGLSSGSPRIPLLRESMLDDGALLRWQTLNRHRLSSLSITVKLCPRFYST